MPVIQGLCLRAALDEICADYDEDQLALVTRFLARLAAAGEHVVADVTEAQMP